MKRVLLLWMVAGCNTAPMDEPPPLDVPKNGLQLVSPEFEMAPGSETFKCWYTTIPTDTEVAAVKFSSKMTPGSHHFIVYTTEQPLRPDGTFEDCDGAGGGSLADAPVWLYSAQDPEHHLNMPTGVAMPLKARQPLYFNMHYINTRPEAFKVKVWLNLEYATGSYERAGAFVTFNTNISMKPGASQTVSGDCAVPDGAKFFTMSTHSHKYTTNAFAARMMNGVMGDKLVHTTDWEHAQVVDWSTPFLTLQQGEKVHYECSFVNTSPHQLTVGESAEKNEMCMAVGYFFPAKGTRVCLNSLSFDR
jgi:hypothetical protein